MLLQIRHIGMSEDGKHLFVVMRDGKQTKKPVPITSPWEIMIGTQTLQQGLRWYLEKYLELPVDNFCTQAEEIQAVLSQWKRDCFDALFSKGQARSWYRNAQQENFTKSQLQIISDDVMVWSWPWEVLENLDNALPAQQCRIERCIGEIGGVRTLPEKLPAEQLNILYIIARPYGDRDVGFQTLVRPLIDFVNEGGWPVHIDVLRPPTFDRLRVVLEESPCFYHIVHFDGHGGYLDSRGNRTKDSRPSGKLVFEKDDNSHSAHEIPGAMLAELLQEHNIPIVVLNACQSAMNETDPFASVAANLLIAGIHGVVAMSYSLRVSGAKVFVPAFYQNLFQKGDLVEAIHAGRREMYRSQMRDTFFGQVPFQDWMVPVLYQQSAEDVLPKLEAGEKYKSILPKEALDIGDYGFVGRDRAIKSLERAIRMDPAGILIHGMAGEGKTTLAKGFLHWLEATHGLGNGIFWFSFEDIHSAEYIINTLVDVLLGTQAMALPVEQKLSALTKMLRKNRFFIVYDNFESASGIPGTEVSALLPEEDRVLLKKLLHDLHGGQSKVLITSRSPEIWLSSQECSRLPLEGLKGEELWQYCNTVVADLGLSLERESETYKKLIDKLEGNPLAVRVILLLLREKSAEALLAELEEDVHGLEVDEGTRRIQAALSVFERGLDRAFVPVLRLIGLHEHYLDAKLLWQMLESKKEITMPLKGCLSALESAGLCHHTKDDFFQIHPTLRGFLTRLHPAGEVDRQAFVKVFSHFMNEYAQREMCEQQIVLFGANFYHALRLAQKMDMHEDVLVIMSGLVEHTYKTRNFFEAERLCVHLAIKAEEYGDNEKLALAFNQRGNIAKGQRDFEPAINWYKKSLAIKLKQGNEHGMAIIYNNLGYLAQEQRDLEGAEDWYKKSLSISLKMGDEYLQASIYHNLGVIAQEQRDFETAINWYKKSLDIKLKLGNEHGIAGTYHDLGYLAQKQRDFKGAESWYKKSLPIFLKLGDEDMVASTYHNLGVIAQEQRDFETAINRYKKSLAIKLKQGNEHGIAGIYHNLGYLTQEQRDFEGAKGWYKKSLPIFLKLDDKYMIASAYHNLGIIALEQWGLGATSNWYKKSLAIKLKQGDEHDIEDNYHDLRYLVQEQWDIEVAINWYKKSLAIRLKQGNDYSIAGAYHDQGYFAQELGDFESAEDWYKKSLPIFLKLGDEFMVAVTYNNLGIVAQERRYFETAKDWYKKSLDIKLRQGDEYGAAQTCYNLGIVAEKQRDFKAANDWCTKSLTIFLELGDEYMAALTYILMGLIAGKRWKFRAANSLFSKAHAIFERYKDEYHLEIIRRNIEWVSQKNPLMKLLIFPSVLTLIVLFLISGFDSNSWRPSWNTVLVVSFAYGVYKSKGAVAKRGLTKSQSQHIVYHYFENHNT